MSAMERSLLQELITVSYRDQRSPEALVKAQNCDVYLLHDDYVVAPSKEKNVVNAQYTRTPPSL